MLFDIYVQHNHKKNPFLSKEKLFDVFFLVKASFPSFFYIMRVVVVTSKSDVVTRSVINRLKEDGHEVSISKETKGTNAVVLDLRGEGLSSAREIVSRFVEDSERDEGSSSKVLIALSTLMSWDNTPKEKLDESKWTERIPRTTRREILRAENSILNANSESLRSVVIGFGLVYGSGEGILKSYFKTMWTQGENATLTIPSWNGEAENVVPSIHAKDLASLVSASLLKTRSDFKYGTSSSGEYIAAVDESRETLSNIVSAIGRCFHEKSSTRVMTERDVEKALLTEDSTMLIDPTLLLDMNFQSSNASQLLEQAGQEWWAREGLVRHVERWLG